MTSRKVTVTGTKDKLLHCFIHEVFQMQQVWFMIKEIPDLESEQNIEDETMCAWHVEFYLSMSAHKDFI